MLRITSAEVSYPQMMGPAPEKNNYSSLFIKAIQQSPSRKLKRRRYSYESNHSIARKLGEHEGPGAPLLDQEVIRDAIGDHAYRRIQIFYYQSLAYFNMGCDIKKGKTEDQYGTSNYIWSNAAHSSLLPNLQDNFFELQQERKGLISQSSALYKSMNATVELPIEVNAYDVLIENEMRGTAIKLLNAASKEGLHPYEAAKALVSEMNTFFFKSAQETRDKIKALKKIEKLEKQIWSIESRICPDTVDAYLEHIRRLEKETHKFNEMKQYSMHKKTAIGPGWRASLLTARKINRMRLAKRIMSMRPEMPETRADYIKLLENSLKIIEIQWNSTRVPPLKSLSKGELFKEQLEIIKGEL